MSGQAVHIVRIAVVRSLDGHVTVCGPDDHSDDYADPMEAAICWHIEAGHEPADKCWISATLPDVRSVIPEVQASAEVAS